jgi:hypothetical protein
MISTAVRLNISIDGSSLSYFQVLSLALPSIVWLLSQISCSEVSYWVAAAVASTWLKYCASHHNFSLTRHVSAIQKDACFSLCNLPGRSDRLRNTYDTGKECVCGWASFRLMCIRLITLISVELVLSGAHLCSYQDSDKDLFLSQMTWTLFTTWEILALCLAIWIAIKHFCEVSMGWAVGGCFTILIETHVFYFARWVPDLNAAILSHLSSALVFLLLLAFRSLISLPKSRYAHLRLIPASDQSFTRTHLPRQLITFLV